MMTPDWLKLDHVATGGAVQTAKNTVNTLVRWTTESSPVTLGRLCIALTEGV